MRQRQIDLDAATPDEAVRLAVERLDAPAHRLAAEETDEGRFRVTVVEADAEMEVGVSDDESEAFVAAYAPPLGDGSPLDEAAIRRALTDAGVTETPEPTALAEVLHDLVDGKDPTGAVLVRGTPSRAERPPRFDPVGDVRCPVLPGMRAGTLHPAEPGRPGRTATGRTIDPPEASSDASTTIGAGLRLEADGASVTAADYGLLRRGLGTAEVEPLYEAASDGSEVRATLYATDLAGRAITPARLREAFGLLGFTHGFREDIAAEALGELQYAAKTDPDAPPAARPETPVLASVPPVPGEDARLEITAPGPSEPEEDAAGRIDHRERSGLVLAAEGETIARIQPPSEGTPGVTVRGEPIPAEPGREIDAQAGENVAVSEDGRVFTATTGGVVVRSGTTLSVTDLLEIPGDVDYESGNIHLEKGSVRIKGGVRDGFTVEAPGGVEVGESVERAEINAGGDVYVRQGLLLHGTGVVRAGGGVYARYAENSHIHAAGDVIVDNDLANCDVSAGGRIIATRAKGVVMGGSLRAAEGMEMNELGSELGVTTLVTLGREDDDRRRLQEELRRLREMQRKIERVIGDDEPRAILERTPPAKRKAVAEVIKAKMAVLNRQEEAAQELEEKTREVKRAMRAEIRVLRTLHPGVSVAIAGAHATVEQSVRTCRILYDPARDGILFLPLTA